VNIPHHWQSAVVEDGTGAKLEMFLDLDDDRDRVPADVREGLDRRRHVARHGRCPCGAILVVVENRAMRRRAKSGTGRNGYIDHQPDCPAGDDRLLAALRRWRA